MELVNLNNEDILFQCPGSVPAQVIMSHLSKFLPQFSLAFSDFLPVQKNSLTVQLAAE